ncbi:Putative pyridoxal phosphate-dependent aminotransferase (plasmid) [Streptomyces clavuligerus]|uniref:Putative pyridoxal phosphate-dependent aminotransferase n=2 Tax=Streptomyces clavuligerus TaxID=1901 RepID=D5SKX1_STRCL|nr:Putative pyridoxal phosphate-dependent aminotransferase [Streptomyces clavuligerus]
MAGRRPPRPTEEPPLDTYAADTYPRSGTHPEPRPDAPPHARPGTRPGTRSEPRPDPGAEAAWLLAADRAHMFHPVLPRGREDRTVLVSGRGCTVRDTEGRTYLDASSVLGLTQIGHGREEIAQAAAEQMRTLGHFHTWGTISNDKAIRLAARLTDLAPQGLQRVYFTSGGGEGVEIALRMARYFHHRTGSPERTWILSRRTAYHGIGYGSGTVSGSPAYQDGFGPVLPHVHHLTPPDPYHAELYDGEDVTEYCLRELARTIDEIGPGRIAAMIGEPVMGAGGAVVPPPDYWPRVAALLRSHGILLILDEVVTAFGRTGTWFAAEHFGVTPDLLVTAKGITSGYVPHGAVLLTEEVADAVNGETGFPIGFTYTGHPTACAVALANLDIIEREGLLENAVKVGDHLAGRLAALRGLPAVGDVRQLGMMLAVELVSDKTARTPLPGGTLGVVDALREDAGVIVRATPRSLVLNPALVMDRATADEVADGLDSVLRRLAPDGRIGAAPRRG